MQCQCKPLHHKIGSQKKCGRQLLKHQSSNRLRWQRESIMQWIQNNDSVGTLAVCRSTLLLNVNWSAVPRCRNSESQSFCAIIVHIRTSNQPTTALSAVLCCRSGESKSDQWTRYRRRITLHWGLKAGLVTPFMRQTNQAMSRCCVVDRETLS